MLKFVLTLLYLSLLIALLYQPIVVQDEDIPNDYNLLKKEQMKVNPKSSLQKFAKQASATAKDSLADRLSLPVLNAPLPTNTNFASAQISKRKN